MGRPKASLPFGPEVLLQRVVRLVSTVTGFVVVVAAPEQVLPTLPATVRVVRDPEEGQGPLRGLATGLAAFPATIDLVYATSTDVPFLEPPWVERLVSLIGEDDLLVPEVGGHLHPLAALYRRGPTLAAAEVLLAAGERRLGSLLGSVRGRPLASKLLEKADPAFATLRNLNTPEDYRRALVDAGWPDDDIPDY